MAHSLAKRQQQQLSRTRYALAHIENHVQHQHQTYLNFSSNDYLGLAQEPCLKNAWQEGIKRYGNGSGGSALITGYTSIHQQLEEQLALWLGFDKALLFQSGFCANQAVLLSLLEQDDVLIQDKLNHVSLIEAGLLSPAKMTRFLHNDTNSLESILTRSKAQNKFIVTEGVFSMDGDCSPLQNIASLCRQHQAFLMVDDAHGCGVLSDDGAGSCAAVNIKPDLLVITFGKAFGLSGAAVLCDKTTADYLVQYARHYIYSTAMAPAQAYAISQACSMVQQERWRRDKLEELSTVLHNKLADYIDIKTTKTPIKPWIVGNNEKALRMAQQLKQQGCWVTAIREPTIPKNTARLRINLSATHTKEHIDYLSKSILLTMED